MFVHTFILCDLTNKSAHCIKWGEPQGSGGGGGGGEDIMKWADNVFHISDANKKTH